MGCLGVQARRSAIQVQETGCPCQEAHLVGYNTKNKTYWLWDPAEHLKSTNSAEVSFREKETRDVVPPKAGNDPFPEPGRIIYQPGSTETK